MMKALVFGKRSDDSGFTLVELVLAMLLTSMLALGAMKLLGAGVTSMQYNQTVAMTGSSNSNLNSIFTRDISETNGFVVPSSSGVDTISQVVGDGTYATYTYTGNNSLVAGQNVSVSGISTAGFNMVNAAVVAADLTAKTFVLANSTVGTVTAQSGTLTVLCTTWKSTDSTYASVHPLVTLSQQKSLLITAASGNGSTATYTYAGSDILVPGQGITVSGLTPGSLNFVNQPIVSIDSAANTFTVSSTSTDTAVVTSTTQGAASFNNFVGYEVHTNNGAGEIWRVQCLAPATTSTSANSQFLRGGLPVANNAVWNASITCSAFASGATVSSTCPSNSFLNSVTSYPGITFLIPATTAVQSSTGLTQYASQVILGARSIS